jgi:hypothetical protein
METASFNINLYMSHGTSQNILQKVTEVSILEQILYKYARHKVVGI